MLDLVRSFVGCPSSDVHILNLPNEILLAYAFADCVVLLNARTFAFVRALAFREVFPSARDTSDHVKCVSIEPGMKLIAASLGHHVALWSLSGVQKDTWRVHSSLSTSDSEAVTAIDCKSGLLGVGSASCLSVYTLGLEEDLLVWTRKWSISAQPYSTVRFSPSLMHVACITTDDNIVRVYSTASGSLLQILRHPRPVKDFIWRFSEKSSRDDLILYTVTTDATLRIFLPVLDTPDFLQLHASLDLYSDSPHQAISKAGSPHSGIFWLHKDTLADSFNTIVSEKSNHEDDTRYRRLKEMNDEGWDFFARVFPDNLLSLNRIQNIDHRPPTLLKQFTLLQSPPSILSSYPRHLHILKTPKHSSLIFVTSPPLRTYEMDPLQFFEEDGRNGMILLAQGPSFNESDTSKIIRFVRTPEGRGLAIVRESSVEAWHLHSGSAEMRRLGRWKGANLVAVLERGKSVALYSESSEKTMLTLHRSPQLSSPVSFDVPRLISLFCLPSGSSDFLIGITPSYTIVHIEVPSLDQPQPPLLKPTSVTSTSLPSSKPLVLVIPVDPMAWSSTRKSGNNCAHDILLSISNDGELAFWALEKGRFHRSWVCTGHVRTGKTGYRLARCSSAKKTALVSPGSNGDELTIWDSKESEFASGLEYRQIFKDEAINDLDWTSTPDLQSVLAIGFSQHVVLLCQQRMTYFNEEPAWGTLGRVEIGHMLTHQISDSIWLAGGTLLVGAGHHMLQYGQCKPSTSNENKPVGLFEHVVWLNGPLPHYHPQMILQCLLWGKVGLVKEIIVSLFKFLKNSSVEGRRPAKELSSVPIERFLETDWKSPSSKDVMARPQYSVLFGGTEETHLGEDQDRFSRSLVQYVIDELEISPLVHLTSNEHAHLLVLLQTTLEIDEQSRALDSNGLRYLISMRSFYILNARVSSPSPPGSPVSEGHNSYQYKRTFGRERLRFRDMVWAFHSESQEILLATSTLACGGKMKWVDAKALGIFLWLSSTESMKTQMEVIARNQYMSGDDRDPTSCSLFYFALGKVRLVHGLWKQAAWHKEQALMLKFLSNDFSQPRWRTAALKNAYALLSKQRFEYAAAFFILGGSLKDAVHVCVKQLNDPQLAVALARVVEQGEERPILSDILMSVIVPIAFEKGNRWLGSWAFWLLNRRDLAVRILVSPLEDVSKSLDIPISDIGDPNYDDPSLALLFSQLKSKTLQTAKGTNEISGRTEFKFVLQTARVFCRMGCHALALDLVRSWSFERPTVPRRASNALGDSEDTLGPLQDGNRRPVFTFPGHKRRSSIVIDMEVPSDPSTRSASPEPPVAKQTPLVKNSNKAVGDATSRKTGLGSLMKTAKQDVSVPDFDMNAFF
ncbi:RAVE protein 1 C terminal-domain-containing protein [Phellopilus nigrolimitatus]|nr:RAVE protein 1 C terminal-domain-containing protein [Phellopilus nigrolimitatus]